MAEKCTQASRGFPDTTQPVGLHRPHNISNVADVQAKKQALLDEISALDAAGQEGMQGGPFSYGWNEQSSGPAQTAAFGYHAAAKAIPHAAPQGHSSDGQGMAKALRQLPPQAEAHARAQQGSYKASMLASVPQYYSMPPEASRMPQQFSMPSQPVIAPYQHSMESYANRMPQQYNMPSQAPQQYSMPSEAGTMAQQYSAPVHAISEQHSIPDKQGIKPGMSGLQEIHASAGHMASSSADGQSSTFVVPADKVVHLLASSLFTAMTLFVLPV